ncbi:transposase for insertion sequence element IS6501 [Brucella suis ATCC 23445]|uniref:Transposase for insertion sequence element IS6501 n=1 Tax=Brucella suis (strain ATCC 23445 / NCTC 10510) TaxID=470137 RepID=B0CKJ6_BRUSI|nr:transposase for insertion sequence element IS6501 [Brucella suis ATCC 23445]
MKIHKNARLTPLRREEMAVAVLGGRLTKAQAARLYGVSLKIVSRWTERFRISGRAAMTDRSSRPTRSPRQMGQDIVERILHLRRQRLTGKHIAMETGVSPATVSRILRRAKLSRMKDIDPVEPVIRYEYAEPGGLIHLDIKRLGRFERVGHRITGNRTRQSNARGVGWEYVHVCIDDVSRIAFTDIFPDEKHHAIAVLKAAVAYYASLGVTVTRVMTDNGACYIAKACKALDLKHIRTKPYTPKTNGKAERFIQTALREWAYARAYPSSQIRKAHLPNWTHMYNWHRPHSGLKSKTPISRLGLNRDNLLTLHS